MSVFGTFRGILNSLFQLGKGGPQLKNAAGAIEARDAVDGAYAVVRGASPSGASDFATKGWTVASNVPYDDSENPPLDAATVQAAFDRLKTFAPPVRVGMLPALGGKPAALVVSPAGQLWCIDFGNGGSPSKPYGFEVYDITTNPAAPARVGYWLQNVGGSAPAWFNVYVIKFVGTTMFATVNGNGPSNALKSVDTTNPAAPTNLGSLALPGVCQDLAISTDNLTAISPGNGVGGLNFSDISNPAALAAFAGAAVTQAILPTSSWYGVDAQLWPILFTTDYGNGFLRVYDCTNVRTNVPPTLIGSLNFASAPVGTSLASPTGIRKLTLDPLTNLLYVVNQSGQYVSIVNVATPATPVFVSTFPFGCGGSSELKPRILHTGGKVLFVMCTGASGPGRIEVWDVTVPATPTRVRFYEGMQALFDIIPNATYSYVSNRGGEQELVTLLTETLLPY